jgi:hypothetical protein
MAFSGCSSAGRHAARPAAARELGAGGASAAAAGCRTRRRLLRCRCDAGEQQDGAVVGAPAPLLTSKTAQRLKVSMMSLGCPKNVVDGAQPHGHAWRSAPLRILQPQWHAPRSSGRCIALAGFARRLAYAAVTAVPPAQTLTPAALLGCTPRVTRQV